MIRSLLVANRGEIACRIFRTARRMGIESVAVHSDPDAGAAHVRAADRVIAIGGAAARESYLDGARVIAAAKEAGAEAIHPGYGFLSENADFAEAVTAAGLIWVGPPPAAIRAMGLKDAAKARMIEAGVPVTPGYLGEDQDEARLAKEAARIGFPVMIKAVAGGGGKGMRKVDQARDFPAALAAARREAASSFGDDRVILETYVARPRHIEVQVFGDLHGNLVHLFERDCSLQRRSQKVIEEAPAPGMDEATRAAVTAAAVKAAQAVGYVGAGTVEFIADASAGLRADRIWFMEMNTRLQVEHPVTEAVTGLDLVEWQIRVAAGEPLPLRQDEITLSGCALEARLYAEDPAAGFLPSVGRLDHFRLPENARVDSGYAAGDEVSAFYDPMLAKLVAHADTREAAAAALAEACDAVEAWPVRTNAGFLSRCLENPDFIAGQVDTAFIADRLADLATRPEPSQAALAAAGAAALLQATSEEVPASPWTSLAGFRLNGPLASETRLFLDGAPISAPLWREGAPGRNLLLGEPGEIVVFEAGEAFAFGLEPPTAVHGEEVGDGEIRAPLPAKVAAVMAAPGQAVTRGDGLLVLEAMKMEHVLSAPFDGKVEAVLATAGDQVTEGAVLVRLVAAERS
jgi:acetyl/propionyl-CoA carboxylase alpha subunit